MPHQKISTTAQVMNNQNLAHKSLNHYHTVLHRIAYARLIKLSTTTHARASYYVPLNDHFIDHYTHRTAYARLIKLSNTTRARACYYVPLDGHFIGHFTHQTLRTPLLLRY